MITQTHTKQPSLSGVALTSAQSPEEQVIKEPVSSERTSEDSENASELILPKVSCPSDKSMISKEKENLSKYTDFGKIVLHIWRKQPKNSLKILKLIN